MKRVTIKDVAADVGVSISVVSYVINGATKPSISEATKNRVMEAVNRLGYTPNRNAAILRSRKSYTIGVVSYWADSYMHTSFLDGIVAAAEKNGYRALSFLATETTEAMHYVEYVEDHMFDGIILIPPYESRRKRMNFRLVDHIEYMKSNKIPFVVLGDVEKGVDAPFVAINYYRTAYVATEYYISKGYKDITYVSRLMDAVDARERYEGYCQAMKAHKLKAQFCPESEMEERMRDFKAVVTDKSGTARKVIVMANKIGYRIPDDFELVAANAEYYSKHLIPSLTTVSVPAKEMGAKTVEELLEVMKGQSISNVTILDDYTLDFRDTTK